MEFYVAFWPLVGKDYVDTINSGFLNMQLTIHKRDDPLEMKNWRPITLLNVDYKIATRCISGRLLKVISSVVSDDQTCGIPGRFIGCNVASIRDIVHYAAVGDIPMGLLSLDQEKAFDRVDWSFMHRTLSSMGFGPSLCGWVRLFYTGVSSAVLVNGYISEFFDLSRGVRQGCPLSALLYVLTAEVLACNIRACYRNRGVSLPSDPSQQAKISQYADDTVIICTTDDSVVASFEVYAQYEKASGARINASKSKGLWLGPWCHRTDPPVQLRWSSDFLPGFGFLASATALFPWKEPGR
jgi:hypothetical protein